MFTVTVTAKSTEAPATTATTQASADATTGAVATTEAPASSDASGNALKKITLSTTSPKVGDVVRVILDPVTATDVKSYEWYEDNVKVSGNATNSYSVTNASVGKIIKAVVYNNDGTKFESDSTSAVVVDNSKSVTIKDLNGFQSNGTAYVTDSLSLVFGDSFGLPQSVSWYVNGSLKYSIDKSAGAIDVDSMSYRGTATGQCYALVTMPDGTSYKSNIVSIVAVPVAVAMSDVKITEDSAKTTLAAETNQFVVSVTLNKDYAGKMYLVDASESNITDDTCKSGVSAVITEGSPLISTKTESKDMNEASVITGSTADDNKTAKCHVFKRSLGENASGDCPVQYMFQVSTALTRGTAYKVVFDQDGLDTDNISSSNNKTANLSAPATAAYVKAPTSIKVTDIKTASDDKGWTATLYVGDSVCEYLSEDPLNLTSCKLHAGKSTATTGGADFNADPDVLDKGVFKNKTTGCFGPKDNTYIYATFTGTKGIFQKDELKLTSVAVKTAGKIATATSLTESATKPKNVDVTFENVAASADAYLVTSPSMYTHTKNAKGEDADSVTTSKDMNYDKNKDGIYDVGDDDQVDYSKAETLKAAIANLDPKKSTTYVAKVEIGPGQSSATFADVLTKVNDKDNDDVYTLVILPKDSSAFATYENTTGYTLTQNETSYKLDSVDDTIRDSKPGSPKVVITFLDQFGEKINGTAKAINKELTNFAVAKNTGSSVLTLHIEKDGTVWTALKTDKKDDAEKDAFVFSMNESQNLVITVKAVDGNNTITDLNYVIK